MRIILLALVAATTFAHADPACESADACKKRCDAGSQESCARLGIIDLRAHDVANAEPLLDRACKAKVAVGCGALGSLYATSRDFKRARPLFDSACTMGDAVACEHLGELMVNGDDPVVDWKEIPRKSAVVFRRACDLGEGHGCAFVASFILQSVIAGTEQEVLELYTKACNLDVAVGCRKAGEFVTDVRFTRTAFAKNIDAARLEAQLFARGCTLGDTESCTHVKKP